MCCPYECPPQTCSSNESIEEDCNYDTCCQCSDCQGPCLPPCCPPRPCTPFPYCPPRRVRRSCNPCCPPPRCRPRTCSPPPPRCPPRPCIPPPCCPCKVKGKFGLAYIVETPKNRCETPLGWQIEFEDTPSKIASSCKKMMQWVNCPPLGECGTEAVMSGYPKKCARSLACSPYEDEAPPPCDCESEPKCSCHPKPQKCCKPRPQRRKPCCSPPPQPSCCCGKQERKRYDEAGCSCCEKRGSNTPRGDDDSLDYVPDKEVHHKGKNNRENQKKEQHKDSKYVQHDQSHHGKDEESANWPTRTSSIVSCQLVQQDGTLSPSKKGLYSETSLLDENNDKQNRNYESELSDEIKGTAAESSNKQNAYQNYHSSVAEQVLHSKNSVTDKSNNKQTRNQYPTLSVGELYSKNRPVGETNGKQKNNQHLEDNNANATNKDMKSPSHTTQIESEIIIDSDTLIAERSPNNVKKMNPKMLREKIREARKHQLDIIHKEAERFHEIEQKLPRVSGQSDPSYKNKITQRSSQQSPTNGIKTVADSENGTVEIITENRIYTRSSNQEFDEEDKSSNNV